jgi:hypothetical protein
LIEERCVGKIFYGSEYRKCNNDRGEFETQFVSIIFMTPFLMTVMTVLQQVPDLQILLGYIFMVFTHQT